MPIWLRKFYMKKLVEAKEKEKAQYEKSKGISRPNIGRKR